MTAAFTACLAGGAVFVAGRVVLLVAAWRRPGRFVRSGAVPLAVFLCPIGGLSALAGLVGMQRAAAIGVRPPLPLDLLSATAGVVVVTSFVLSRPARLRRPHRRRPVRSR